MGMFATVFVSPEVSLPHFPEEIDRENHGWQSKQGLDVYGGPYRITADGRLEKKRSSYREKTDEEKQDESSEWGFDSWEKFVQAYDECDGMYPDSVEAQDFDEEFPPSYPTVRVVDEEWWGDMSYHGTFEFHELIREDPRSEEQVVGVDGEPITNDGGEPVIRRDDYALDVLLEYEAHFTEGELDDIVFVGSRHHSDNPIEDALNAIEEWREWKEQQ